MCSFPPPPCAVSSIFKVLNVFSPFLILSARRPLRVILARHLGCLDKDARGFSRLVALVIRLGLCPRLYTGLGRFLFGAGTRCIFLGELQFIFYFSMWSMWSPSSPHQTSPDAQPSRLEVLGALLLTSPSAVAL